MDVSGWLYLDVFGCLWMSLDVRALDKSLTRIPNAMATICRTYKVMLDTNPVKYEDVKDGLWAMGNRMIAAGREMFVWLPRCGAYTANTESVGETREPTCLRGLATNFPSFASHSCKTTGWVSTT